MDGIGLRVVRGGAGSAAEASVPMPDPVAFQEECLQAFEVSQVARGFSELTIGNGAGTLRRFQLLDVVPRFRSCESVQLLAASPAVGEVVRSQVRSLKRRAVLKRWLPDCTQFT